jgi:hypothetical protein
MLLPGINLVPVIERVMNDAASVLGIAALLFGLLKKIKSRRGENASDAPSFLKKSKILRTA